MQGSLGIHKQKERFQKAIRWKHLQYLEASRVGTLTEKCIANRMHLYRDWLGQASRILASFEFAFARALLMLLLRPLPQKEMRRSEITKLATGGKNMDLSERLQDGHQVRLARLPHQGPWTPRPRRRQILVSRLEGSGRPNSDHISAPVPKQNPSLTQVCISGFRSQAVVFFSPFP